MRHRRLKVNDRGASIVEASVITTLLFLLIFGVIEGGLTFGDYLGLANSTRSPGPGSRAPPGATA